MKLRLREDGARRPGVPECLADLVQVCHSSVRIEILFALADGPLEVTVLAGMVELAVARVSHHLRPLREAGWVSARRMQQRKEYTLERCVLVGRSGEGVCLEVRAADGAGLLLRSPTMAITPQPPLVILPRDRAAPGRVLRDDVR